MLKLKRYYGTSRKKRWFVAASAIGIFSVLNCIVGVVYHEQAYPRTRVGTVAVGNQSFSSLEKSLATKVPKPSAIELTYQDKKLLVETNKLGLDVDSTETVERIKKERSFLPMLNLLKKHPVVPATAVNDQAFNDVSGLIKETFYIPPTNATLHLQDTGFIIEEAKDGHEIDLAKLKPQLLTTFSSNESKMEVPLISVKPQVSTASLQEPLQLLQTKIALEIRFTYLSKDLRPSPKEIGSWFVNDAGKYVVSGEHVANYLVNAGRYFGIQLSNSAQAVDATTAALNKNEKLVFGLEAVPVGAQHTYCVALKNVDGAFLNEFSTKAAAVYADSRGWTKSGKVSLRKVDSNCSFTLWLSAPDQLPSFGAVCDEYYSCQIGKNVVINFDRWRYATAPWNAAGGSLDNYRSMVINHETGHWLGFYHRNCPGPGQPAPVMQQQSIDLQGCAFNPWPIQAELDSL